MTIEVDLRTIEAAQAGCESSLEALIRAAWPHAWRLGFAVLKDRDLAQDVAQDAVIRVAERLSALRDPAAFSVWFAQIVLRLAMRARPRPASRSAYTEGCKFAADPQDVVERLDVLDALSSLTPKQRAALYLSALGYNSSEIAQIVGLVPGTVRYVLSTSRRKLRARLIGSPPHAISRKAVEAP